MHGPVLWIRTHFFGFGSTHFFSDSDLYTNILTWNVLKWCLSLLSFVFSSIKCLICDFSQKFFMLQQCLDPNLNPNPNPNFFSDSDPAKIFGLFRFRIHNTGMGCPLLQGLRQRPVPLSFSWLYCACVGHAWVAHCCKATAWLRPLPALYTHLVDFIVRRTCMGCPLLQGYGLTETTACATLMQTDEFSTGRVGPPVQGINIRYQSVIYLHCW
jgi:hypothetical protein